MSKFPQSPQDQLRDRRSLVGLVGLVVIYHKGIANGSAAFNAIGHFGQEVGKIEPSPKVSDKVCISVPSASHGE
jgi:hypothetical protein